MSLLLFLLVLAVVAAIVAIFTGRLPGGMPDPSSNVPVVRLPDAPVAGQDIHRLRFTPALRGYRMDQVDDVLDRLAREVDRLRALVPPEQLADLDAARTIENRDAEPGPRPADPAYPWTPAETGPSQER